MKVVEGQITIWLQPRDAAIVFRIDGQEAYIPRADGEAGHQVMKAAIAATLFAPANQDLWTTLTERFKERYDK